MDKNDSLKRIERDITSGKRKEAFLSLSSLATPEDDFLLQKKFVSLLTGLEEEVKRLKKIRVAILCSATATHFIPVLKFWLAVEGFDAEMYESEFGAIQQTILDPASRLYQFKPDIVYIMTNYRDVKCCVPAGSSMETIEGMVNAAVNEVASLWKELQSRLNSFIIQNNADIPYQRVFGNFETSPAGGYVYALRQFNQNLTKAVGPGMAVLDIDFLASVYGRRRWHDNCFWYLSKHPFALDATGMLAHQVAKTMAAIKGGAKKCLVLDLDNTLWGGIIGDDGLEGIELGAGAAGEAFVDFQKFLLKLKERGILLAVCSKNDEDTAREPFLKHPDMVLKLDDITIFKANWADKAGNIRDIAHKLNIGLDSLVFIDDNPVEREFVKTALPEVAVPDLPSDPSDFIDAVSSGSFFETAVFSEEDRLRSSYYQSNSVREEFQAGFSDLSQYLISLKMEMCVGEFDQFNRPRIVQLINKSNQFHLTTTRYTESEIAAIEGSRDRCGIYFKLKDRFGDNGLISAVILEKREDIVFIDTWVMSCRVLSRGVEEFVLGEMVQLARERNAVKLVGQYLPTAKNKLVAGLYERMHFDKVKEENGQITWELYLNQEFPHDNFFIKKAESRLI
jgi:FkbH-like protein